MMPNQGKKIVDWVKLGGYLKFVWADDERYADYVKRVKAEYARQQKEKEAMA